MTKIGIPGDCRAVVGIDKELFLEDISVVYNEGRPVLRPEKTIVVHFQNRFRAFFSWFPLACWCGVQSRESILIPNQGVCIIYKL